MSENYNQSCKLQNCSTRENHATTSKLPDYMRIIITKDAHGRKRQLLIPAALDLDKPKRPRTTFKNYQTEAMEREFRQNPFINEQRRQMLANSIGITEIQVKVWFQNRRTKARKSE